MAAALDIFLDRGEGHPVYLQIAGQIKERIRAGALAQGDRLPPIRTLAAQLGVNRDTVGLAYETLAGEGVVTSHVGRGTFVRGVRSRTPSPAAGRTASLSPVVGRLLALEASRPHYPEREGCIRFHTLTPDPAFFPVEPFRRALNRAFADAGAALLEYGGTLGHPGLREVLAARFAASGLRVTPDEILLCHGASQGISLALRLFAQAGDVVAVEEPTYHNVLAAAEGQALRVAPVPMRRDGPDLDVLDRVLRRPEVKLFYTMPTFHNPMGVTTGLAHRRELLAVAARCGKPVVEDAFEQDLRLTGRPVPSLMALDETQLVVQLHSFSKSLFPGARAGAVVARGPTARGLRALKHATDLGGPLPMQAALADLVRSGAYDRHLATLRARLRRRRDTFLDALAREMPAGVEWTRPDGGYQVWAELPAPLDSRDLFADASREGVLFAPGHQFHHDGRPSRGLRLTFALADEEAIRIGVERLGRLVRARLAGVPAQGATVFV